MESNLNHYKAWLEFLRAVSSIFEEQGFLEVRTPSLVPSGAMESTLHTFKVEGENMYLPTSPEFALKKLWLSGISKNIFEIAGSFRKEELGERHLSEFTMLEFYVEGESFEALKRLTEEFFLNVFKLNASNCKCLKLNELFLGFTGFKLDPDSDKGFLKKVLKFHGLHFKDDYSWNDLYQLIYLNLIEPLLCKDSLIFLENYPPQLAALAKINKEGWASRLEVFYKGVELGNGYDELLDAVEIKERWFRENTEREASGLEAHPIDQVLLDVTNATSVKKGVGIAIGLERVFSLVSGKKEMNENINKTIKVWPF